MRTSDNKQIHSHENQNLKTILNKNVGCTLRGLIKHAAAKVKKGETGWGKLDCAVWDQVWLCNERKGLCTYEEKKRGVQVKRLDINTVIEKA